MEHEHFWAVVQHGWSLPTRQSDAAKVIKKNQEPQKSHKSLAISALKLEG